MTEFSFEQEEKLINLELANAKALLIEKHKLGAISKKNYLQDDHARKMERKSMNLMTRQMTSGGGMLGRSMAMLQQVGGMGMQNYQEKNSLRERVKGGSATTAEKSQFSMLSQSKTMGVFGKLDKIFEKSFGGNSKWNKMFLGKGKMAAGGMALGAAGAGIGLTSKIIDSSPLMQQMLKLLNFGVMLILRPIGDFFGMLMRPILILLLRKFIIPFYQTVYPWFLNAANQLNNSTKAIEDIGDAIVGSVEDSGKFIAAKIDPVIKPNIETGSLKTGSVTGVRVRSLEEMLKPLVKKIIPTAAAATPTIKPPTMKPPVFKSKLQDLAKIDNPRNLPVKKIRTPWLDNQAMVKVPSPKPIITATSKALGVALKGIKAVDAVMSLPAKAAVKLAQLAIKGIDTAFAATDAVTFGAQSKIGNAAKGAASPLTKPVMGVASSAVAKVASTTAAKMATRAIPVVGQVLLAIDGLGSAIQAISPDTYKGINTGVRAGGKSLGIPDWLTAGAMDFIGFGEESTAQQLYGLGEMGVNALTGGGGGSSNNNNGRRGNSVKMARGGMINEEIRGFGKSGTRYTFGEAGSEMVTPMSRMGRSSGGSDSSGVTINVTVNGSIYSDKDMLNFQRTIMRAIETSSTRKAKL